MLKTMLQATASNVLQNWVAGKLSLPIPPLDPASPPVHVNIDYLKSLMVRYITLAILAFLNFLLFVAGVVVAIVAAAHSLDVTDSFQTSSVFWAGVIMAATALVVGIFSGWALLSTKVQPQELVTAQPTAHSFTVSSHVLRPLWEGILAGLASPRSPRETRQSYPAA